MVDSMGGKGIMVTTELDFVQGSLFEENYLVRTLGALAHSPDIALTELVANAWDAGASRVEIIIPKDYGEILIVEDNGVGLTTDEFHSRWMRLGYDRVKHQGKKVLFPEGQEGSRIAYGRKGIGRHGLLCFNDSYEVITCNGGVESRFLISTQSEKQPFILLDEKTKKANGHGTRLEVTVDRNLPDSKGILEIPNSD
jgi:HSP90 family molecular chaperone